MYVSETDIIPQNYLHQQCIENPKLNSVSSNSNLDSKVSSTSFTGKSKKYFSPTYWLNLFGSPNV